MSLNITYKNHTILLIVVSIITWLIYSNSLAVPFYLDDLRSIENNQLLNSATLAELFNVYQMRFVGYFSFWVDYKISGTLAQLHVTNITIHMINSLLVYWLTFQLLNTTHSNNGNKNKLYFALFCALVFASHPLHTQAVTYIVQRLASLATLLYLLAICSYFLARTQEKKSSIILGLIISLLSTIAAIFTKQNTATIPLTIILIELVFFHQLKVKHLFSALFFFLLSTVVVYLVDNQFILSRLELLDKITRENNIYTRWEYFTAQLNVLWIYIGKFFYPVPLRLEYGYSIDHFSKLQTIIAALGHLILIAVAFALRKRIVLFTFGIAFFYITHLVESSIIPIKDLAFEHRMYLPSVGLIIALSGLYLHFKDKFPPRLVLAFLICTCSLFSYLTIQRNILWQDPIKFYQHELSYLPNNCRLLNNLAAEHYKLKQNDEGHALIEHCFNVSDGQFANFEFINNYLAMLITKQDFNRAALVGKKALASPHIDPISKRRILENMGILQMKVNNLPLAEQYFKQALKHPNVLLDSIFALSVTLAKQGKYSEAHHFVIVGLKAEPNNQRGKAILNLLKPLIKKGS